MNNQIPSKKYFSMILMGSLLETYDFSIYGYFAPLLAQLFFPTQNSFSSLLLTFSVFALGFIMRPLGAIFFGYLGDKWGRKKILVLSITLMTFSTLFIGLLPTYAEIGIAAGFILTFCRLIQGFSVGAEFVGSMIYMLEQAPSHQRSFYGSLSIVSGYLAFAFSSLIITVLTYFLSPTALLAWGWRIPFLLGILLGLINLYLRASLPETHEFKTLLRAKAIVKNPFLQVIKSKPLALLKGMNVVLLHSLAFYLIFFYLSSYLSFFYHVPSATISLTNALVLLMAVITIPLVALLAEKIKLEYFMVMSALGFILFGYPLFTLIQQGTFISILLGESGLTFFLCLMSGIVPAYLGRLFPTALRYTGVGFCYNVAVVLFAGTAPLILTFLISKTNNLMIPILYLIFAASVTLSLTFVLSRRALLSSHSPESCVSPVILASPCHPERSEGSP